MTILSILIAILLLGILIAVHEFGHFFFSRLVGIEVREYAIGMGPLLLSHKGKNGTQYSLRLIPVGGYCSFYGEDDITGAQQEDPRAFAKQPVWKRMTSVLMGPGMNFILAFVVAVVFFAAAGITVVQGYQPYVQDVAGSGPAYSAGMQAGDVILTVNGQDVMGEDLDTFITDVMVPANDMKGDAIPVSKLMPMADGTLPSGSAAYEKRGIAVDCPVWIPENCIQCNQCAYVCPHATIRPFALTEEEAAAAPAAAKIVDWKAGKGKGVYKFSMAVSPLDCMGCGVCVGVCPTKAVTMVPREEEQPQEAVWDYMVTKVAQKDELYDLTVKGSQFHQPLLEFSGSCAGCAETSYARLITQVCGDRMYISNATGCSSIWGGPAATSPYTVNKEGRGPAWANSLFEDNAEHGFGLYLGQKAIRDRMKARTEELIKTHAVPELKEAAQKWLDTYNDGKANEEATRAYVAALEESITPIDDLIAFAGSDAGKAVFGDKAAEMKAHAESVKAAGGTHCDCAACDPASEILAHKQYLSKKSVWIFGGDGWAYDIGFGGLDHVLAQGEDVNVMVFDTEVYSNTGGQASKASQIGQVAQFAAAGKTLAKKSLAQIAMTYGYIYVAQIAMGANPAQALKAIAEAEAYPGPSLIIGYAPCEMHSIKGGMTNCQSEMKKAVECGYWNLFRYNPTLLAEGKNPFTLDSKAPTGSYRDFIMNEARYSSLTRSFPDRAEQLFSQAEKTAQERFANLELQKQMFEQEAAAE